MGNYVANFSSVSEGFAPRPPLELRLWTPLGEFRPPDSLVCPQPLLSSDAMHEKRRNDTSKAPRTCCTVT